MIITKFTLALLSLGMLATHTHADPNDFTSQAEKLQKAQRDLDNRINPYRTLAGFTEPSYSDKQAEESRRSPILHLHNSSAGLRAPVGKLLFGRIFNRLVIGI